MKCYPLRTLWYYHINSSDRPLAGTSRMKELVPRPYILDIPTPISKYYAIYKYIRSSYIIIYVYNISHLRSFQYFISFILHSWIYCLSLLDYRRFSTDPFLPKILDWRYLPSENQKGGHLGWSILFAELFSLKLQSNGPYHMGVPTGTFVTNEGPVERTKSCTKSVESAKCRFDVFWTHLVLTWEMWVVQPLHQVDRNPKSG